MNAVDLDDYVPQHLLEHPESGWRHQERLASVAWLVRHGFPTTHDEPFHYTPVDRVLTALRDRPAPGPGTEQAAPTPATTTPEPRARGGDGLRIVIVDGVFDPEGSRLAPAEGITVSPVELAADGPGLAAASSAEARPDGIVALNRATATGGVVIDVAPGVEVDEPVHIDHRSSGPRLGAPHSPAVRIRVGAGARIDVVETFLGSGAAEATPSGATNAVTEVDLGADAQVSHQRVQAEDRGIVHLGHLRFRLDARARLRTTSVTLGAAVSRVSVDVTLAGDDSAADLSGLYLPRGGQHHEHVITVDHVGSDTTSSQDYRGVIDDRGRGSFTGHVIVAPNTTGTEATQSNRSLLLSRTARADARPWLEILADDVQCSHGATVGRLDDDQVFYLRSRGIPEQQARHLLIDAFAAEITSAITPPWLQDQVATLVEDHRHSTETPA